MRSALLLATALAFISPAFARQPEADTILTNGIVYTVDAKDHVAQAVALQGGRIIYVGSSAGAERLAGSKTRRIDLKGHMVMPGLVDGHMHPLFGGRELIGCSLHYAALTEAEFSQHIRACHEDASVAKPGGWLLVSAWFQAAMKPAGLVLTHETLDRIDATHPIVVTSSFGHSALLNSAALAAAGITAATKAPVGGAIHHDASGNPTGLLEDTAMDLIEHVRPAPSAEQDKRAAAAALLAMRRQGVTGFLDALAVQPSLDAFTTLQKEGRLTARAHFAPLIDPEKGPDVAGSVAYVTGMAKRYDQGPIMVQPGITVRNAKLFMDGVISAPELTGVVLEPYYVNRGTSAHPDWQPGTSRGPAPYFPPNVLAPLLTALVQAHIDPHMHADGDGAVRVALDAVAATRKTLPEADFRPAIAHDELVSPDDLPRFKALGAVAVLSFQWQKRAPDTVDAAMDILGPERTARIEPSLTLEQAGARISYGSDWPVDPFNEWFALKVGVTRQNAPDAGPNYTAPLGNLPGLSRASVLRAITMNASWELRSDTLTGSLEPGKFADLIILDRNEMTIPAADIAGTHVLLTMVGGRIVYSTGDFAPKTGDTE